jgi:hypothetical protein
MARLGDTYRSEQGSTDSRWTGAVGAEAEKSRFVGAAQRGQDRIVARQGGAKLTGIARIALDHGQPFVRARDLPRRARMRYAHLD